MEKQFYRSTNKKEIFGVCGGLADYFDVDVVWFRLGFVCAAIFGGSGVIVYLILALVLPEAPTPENQEYFTNTNTEEMSEKRKDSGTLIGGLVMVTLGLCFLANNFIPHVSFSKLWPVVLVVIGIGLLLKAKKENQESQNP